MDESLWRKAGWMAPCLSVQALIRPVCTTLLGVRAWAGCPASSRVHSNSCPSSQLCHPAISSSVSLFSSPLQSFPASGSFPVRPGTPWGPPPALCLSCGWREPEKTPASPCHQEGALCLSPRVTWMSPCCWSPVPQGLAFLVPLLLPARWPSTPGPSRRTGVAVLQFRRLSAREPSAGHSRAAPSPWGW